tara:strand:- start:4 stop:438 length:435 start_codon:yes stop_codon:yes gene_type:complete
MAKEEGSVAPNEARTLEDWVEKEVRSVVTGQRLLGASLLTKLSGHQLNAICGAYDTGDVILKVLRSGTDETELTWALDVETLARYAALQASAKSGELPLRAYWRATGKMFGYSQADVATFTGWIEQDPCPCPCVQCRPDLFATN